MRVKDLGEFGLIKALMHTEVPVAGVVVPAGDDAAVVEITPGRRVVYTCDCMVEGVHFLPVARGSDVGFKLMASNISDIAAMGGKPKFAVITVVTPGETHVEWLQDVYQGIRACSHDYDVTLVGGDTSRGTQIVLSIALIGEIEPGREMLRKSAKIGDAVCLTGPLGASAAGLRVVQGQVPKSLAASTWALQRHFRPQPRVAEGQILSGLGCCCANDISDGLASEALEIAESSGVAIELCADNLAARAETVEIARLCGEEPLDYVLYGGEDYELVFCVAPSLLDSIRSALPEVLVVGTVREGKGVSLITATGTLPLRTAYNHFR